MKQVFAFLMVALFIVTPVAAREEIFGVGDKSSPFNRSTQRDFLPATEAFRTTAWRDDDRIYIGFTAAENYYLHRHQFALESLSPGVSFGELALPPGEPMMHASLGEIYVFYDQVVISAPIESNAADNVSLAIEMTFQGCSDQGLCYPPERVELNAQHGSTPAIFAPTSPETP
ncbi:thiol:disulfide interchange protein [Halomonas sp. A40-4]|jgi:thiol:disulfide interchange protein DsbD|uniref:protein-disulfide reductase DsbD domain-containing protein n=1 Tax=Halomonas sp. A40-4 TaxID=2785909 RepID=UPI0018EFD25C|nr:protein-disulfide reductase DsbD domain-containing protein [Halomonas sp. A40-4]QPL44955.1 thiol:disulfide interchange protein [Halomonas sp. A40-4]